MEAVLYYSWPGAEQQPPYLHKAKISKLWRDTLNLPQNTIGGARVTRRAGPQLYTVHRL